MSDVVRKIILKTVMVILMIFDLQTSRRCSDVRT